MRPKERRKKKEYEGRLGDNGGGGGVTGKRSKDLNTN